VDRVVETGGCKGDTDCEESVHLVCLFLELVVDCGAVLELFCAGDEEENVGEGFCCIRVAAEHHVCETDVVVRLIMARGDSDEHCLNVNQVQRSGHLFVEFNVVHHFESEGKVAEETVNTK